MTRTRIEALGLTNASAPSQAPATINWRPPQRGPRFPYRLALES
jgi:hypothetical protein